MTFDDDLRAREKLRAIVNMVLRTTYIREYDLNKPKNRP